MTSRAAVRREELESPSKLRVAAENAPAFVRAPGRDLSTRAIPPAGTQMGSRQWGRILSTLQLIPGANLLVWGLGNDSPFWHNATTGRVVFLEDDIPVRKDGVLWFDEITDKYRFLEAHKVHYTTHMSDLSRYSRSQEHWSELDLRLNLPVSVQNTPWDVIIVDAPLGEPGMQGPGRFQSLYTSYLLLRHSPRARSCGFVFVDDCQRTIEAVMSKKIFGPIYALETRDMTAANRANSQCCFRVQEASSSNVNN